jgi:hypothetical protein
MSRRIYSKLLFIVIAIFALSIFSGILLAQGRRDRDEDFEHVKKVQEKHSDHLMSLDGVEGTAVGLDENDQPVVTVFVEHGNVHGISKKLDDEVSVEVVVSGKFYALPKPSKPTGKPDRELLDPTTRFPRPVPIGVSTGHPDITAGTIGCRVRDRFGNVFALSNNHVYAKENRAFWGDNVLQPGSYDGGVNPNDAIGKLHFFMPIVFSTFAYNTIDAAIAQSSNDLLGNSTPSDGYGTPKSATAKAYIGQFVQKYGRTTRLTRGKVYAFNAIVNVSYDRGVARFVNQIVITPGHFSNGGDSGSLVVVDQKSTDDRKPVGLLFAGSQTFSVANPIDSVLSLFGVTIDGEDE